MVGSDPCFEDIPTNLEVAETMSRRRFRDCIGMLIALKADSRRFSIITTAFAVQDRIRLNGGGKMFQHYAYSRRVRSRL